MIVRSIVGLLCALIALTLVGLGARAMRRRFMPALTGPTAVLASIVLGLGVFVGVAEILGTVGGFSLVPMTIALCLAGAGTARLAPRMDKTVDPLPSPDPGSETVPPVRPARRIGLLWTGGAVLAVAMLVADWMSRVADSWHRGMTTADTLWYHLPTAARFVQEGSIYHLHYVDADSLTVFYPATSELFHAAGMAFLGNDVLSLILNLGWLAMTLFAAWCIGWRFGAAPITLAGVALLLATPELVIDDAGSGLDDIVGLALFLAALALISNALRSEASWKQRRPELLCGALAAGLAAGTKYSMLVPVGALAVGIFALAPRGQKIRFTALWSAVAVVAGGYWYVRNFIAVGNPLPQARLGIRSLHLPVIPFPGMSSIAHFLFRGYVWREFFLPGMSQTFGTLWWILFVVLGVGVVLSVAGRDRTTWLLSFVGLSCLVAFIVTPQALGGLDYPFLFVVNTRYAASALVVGVVLLPVVLHRTRYRTGVLVVYLAVLIDTQWSPLLWRHGTSIIAPTVVGPMPYVVGIVSGALVVMAGLLWVVRRSWWRVPGAALPVVALCALLVGALLFIGAERSYLQHRYKTGTQIAVNDRLLEGDVAPVADRWAQGLHDARVAIVNSFLQYPFYGEDLSNYVQYLAMRSSNGISEPFRSCHAWRQAINDGRYQYVVVATPGFPLSNTQSAPQELWTRSDPAVRLVVEDSLPNAHEWVFQVRRPLSPDLCDSKA